MSGRGGVAGAATTTLQQVCVGNTGRRLPRGLENGLRVLRRQAERKTGSPKAWKAEYKELRARIEALEKKGGEGAQGGLGFPSRTKSGMGEEWRMDMDLEDEVESRRKLEEQKRKLQKEWRDVEKFSCAPKEFQENLKSNLQQQLQEVEQRRHDFMPEYQKAVKRSHKIQSIQDKRRNLQKDSTAAEEETRKLQEELKQSEERILFQSDRVDMNKRRMQKWRQNFRDCRQEKKRRGSDASQTGDCCMEALWQQIIALGTNQAEATSQRHREMGATQGQMPGRDEGRRNSEDEQE